MTLTRRAFITSTATVVSAAAVDTVLQPAAEAATIGSLRRSTFTPHVGKAVMLTSAGRRTVLRLRRIRDVAGAPKGSQTSFILQFTAPRHLADGIYTLSAPGLGRQRLFVSGVGARSQRSYEVVVNHATAPKRRS